MKVLFQGGIRGFLMSAPICWRWVLKSCYESPVLRAAWVTAPAPMAEALHRATGGQDMHSHEGREAVWSDCNERFMQGAHRCTELSARFLMGPSMPDWGVAQYMTKVCEDMAEAMGDIRTCLLPLGVAQLHFLDMMSAGIQGGGDIPRQIMRSALLGWLHSEEARESDDGEGIFAESFPFIFRPTIHPANIRPADLYEAQSTPRLLGSESCIAHFFTLPGLMRGGLSQSGQTAYQGEETLDIVLVGRHGIAARGIDLITVHEEWDLPTPAMVSLEGTMEEFYRWALPLVTKGKHSATLAIDTAYGLTVTPDGETETKHGDWEK